MANDLALSTSDVGALQDVSHYTGLFDGESVPLPDVLGSLMFLVGQDRQLPTSASFCVDDVGKPPTRTFATQARSSDSVASPSLTLPEVRRSQEVFEAIQRWEGYVVALHHDTCVVRLVDLDRKLPESEAELHMSEVDPADHGLVRPGAVFYWHIGYLHRRSGILGASSIRFRRMPVWSLGEYERAKVRAEAVLEEFDQE